MLPELTYGPGRLALLATSALAFTLIVHLTAPHAEASAEELLVLLESTLHAEEPVHVGDKVHYEFHLEHPDHLQVEISSPPEGSRWREVHREITTGAGEAPHHTRGELTYVVLRPGPTRGPPISAIALGHDGDPEELSLPGHPLEVQALTGPDDRLDGPRSGWALHFESARNTLLGGGALALFALALIALLAIRRRGADEAAPEPALPPHEEALRDLDALAASDLLDTEEFKAYHQRLSEIFRRYLGRRWTFPGTELTTSEIADRLAMIDDLQGPSSPLAPDEALDLLRAWDKVKFTDFRPAPDVAKSHLQRARELVEATIPAPDPDETDEPDEEAQP